MTADELKTRHQDLKSARRLTPRQRELYRQLVRFLVRNHRTPTLREACVLMGLAAGNGLAVAPDLKALEGAGLIRSGGQRAHRLRLLGVRLAAEPTDGLAKRLLAREDD